MVIKFIILLLLFPLNAEANEEVVHFKKGDQKWSYVQITILGWNILIEESIKRDQKLYSDIKDQFKKDLKKISLIIPGKSLAFLKSVKFWVSNESKYPFRPKELGVVPFHRSRKWLDKHGLNPEMAGGIHMINPDKVLYHHKVFKWAPMTILHELSHAFHWIYLGYENRLIKEAYEKSVGNGLYKNISSRSKSNYPVEAYASSNRGEYFAELTEAYFGENDYFPKTKHELEKYDPQGFKMVEAVWGLR